MLFILRDYKLVIHHDCHMRNVNDKLPKEITNVLNLLIRSIYVFTLHIPASMGRGVSMYICVHNLGISNCTGDGLLQNA